MRVGRYCEMAKDVFVRRTFAISTFPERAKKTKFPHFANFVFCKIRNFTHFANFIFSETVKLRSFGEQKTYFVIWQFPVIPTFSVFVLIPASIYIIEQQLVKRPAVVWPKSVYLCSTLISGGRLYGSQRWQLVYQTNRWKWINKLFIHCLYLIFIVIFLGLSYIFFLVFVKTTFYIFTLIRFSNCLLTLATVQTPTRNECTADVHVLRSNYREMFKLGVHLCTL